MFKKTIVGLPPLSVNKAWQGKRFKTKANNDYRRELGLLLGNVKKQQIKGWVGVELLFHLPSRQYKTADLDNFCKSLLDVLVEKQLIEDDRFIKKLTLEKIMAEDYTINIYVYPWNSQKTS